MKRELRKKSNRDTLTVVACATMRKTCTCKVRYCQCSGPSAYVTNDSKQYSNSDSTSYVNS